MKQDLLKVAIRQQAVFITESQIKEERGNLSQTTSVLLMNLRKLGYTVSEDLLYALNSIAPNQKVHIYNLMKDVLGVNLNWAPLIQGWDVPTGETRLDHTITFFANYFKSNRGARLECGHLIPDNTFPLERYNGCPFCGTPFKLASIENYGQGSKLKVLDLWTETNLESYLRDLLESKTALDATQVDSLKILVKELEFTDVEISMKETLMIVVDSLVEMGVSYKAQFGFKSPNDILRYLWYKKTGFLQIIEPKTIIKRTMQNNRHVTWKLDRSKNTESEQKRTLKLKYDRPQCRMVAAWLNNLNMDVEKACEIMHPKRGMWIRFIRALRLAEYARKPGFEYLKELMDVFYNQVYTVFQGELQQSRLKADAQKTFVLLKQRPGLFARSLFANMLWFGEEETLQAFREVIDKVPARLIFTLSMYAQNYFDPDQKRVVKPLGGTNRIVGPNQLVGVYTDDQLKAMVAKIEELCIQIVLSRFEKVKTESQTMYIDPMLYNIPLSIGDRSETIQDISCALMGTRFPVEGNSVRLFMQWGKGLPAQHMDMDLSCHIAFPYSTQVCSYFNLTASGAKHSGDIRSIPNKKGTAEYIELDLEKLSHVGARYVVFTCNAYSNGAISPNLVVGWMNSANPMRISERTGVAYDPSCVQHQVRVSQSLSKGLVFGILDVEAREIVWLEQSFGGQTVLNMDARSIETLLEKLKSKTTIGDLLKIKAQAQQIALIESVEADEVYTLQWAMNAAGVTKLLID